ncbi:hypothetical protein [Nostoc sp.]
MWTNSASSIKTYFQKLEFKGDERPKEVGKKNYLWHQSPDEVAAFIKEVDDQPDIATPKAV